MAAQLSSSPESNKRRRAASHDGPQKRSRFSTETSSRSTYITASNIFELQVDELLDDLENQANSNVQKITGLLKQVKEAIEAIPSQQQQLRPREAETFLKAESNTVTPFSVPPPGNAQYSLGYAKPSTINVVGSAANGTLLSRDGRIVADLVVVMPAHLFQEKDYRKYRYFHKKAFYTACIAAGLKRASYDGLTCTFSLQSGNPLQPCLLVRKQADDVVVRIIAVPPMDVFPQDKILPWLNNVPQEASTTNQDEPANTSTPFYNSTIRSEMLMLNYLSLIHKVGKQMPALRKASLLFSTWLCQRGFGTELSKGGLGQFEAQALMAVLLHNDPTNGAQAMFRTRYDHHQLFKATLILLASKDFSENPVLYNFTTHDSSRSSASQPLQNAQPDLIQNTAGMFLDGTRSHNLFFKMSPWACSRLRRQADITVRCLGGADPNRFDHCFISNLNNKMARYDHIMNITVGKVSVQEKSICNSNDPLFDTTATIYKTLKHALGDRVHELSFSMESSGEWATKIERPKTKKLLQLNVVVDAKEAMRVQDVGPSADDKAGAAAFRQFWGPKAELRRFRDGSIQETIIWDVDESQSIIEQIIRYALQRHHGNGTVSSVEEIGSSLWNQLPQPDHSRTLGEFDNIWKTYQRLEEIIRELKMPLAIRQISPASEALRYSLLNLGVGHSAQPIHIVVQFESSGHWPDDLGAIQQVKLAFLQKLADLLSQHNSSLRTRVGIDQEASRSSFRPVLEVVMDSFRFHIVLHHDRELFLLRAKPAVSPEERRALAADIHYHNTMFLRAPAHTSRVRDLCTQYPLLSQSMRLFKAWCSAHLLLPHFREELLELLVIHVFTSPAPYGVPSSLRTAFLRTISMLAKWDWHNEPLLVKMSDETDQQLTDQLNTHFEAWRKIDPSFSRVALIVGSTIDPTGTAWTEQGPSKMIAARLSALCKVTYSMVMKLDLELDPESLFTHSTKNYDFVIYLDAKSLRLAGTDSSGLVSGYLNELQRVFGDSLVWFHTGHSQKLIAGLWNPTVESDKWKVSLGYSTIPVQDTDSNCEKHVVEVKRNSQAIVNEITRLGGELVNRVTVKTGEK